MHTAQSTGSTIHNRYQILEVLGRGGSGITYQARDISNGQSVAIKELSLKGLSDWKKLELFEREAQVLKSLDHPAIPKYLDYFQVDTDHDRYFYIVQALAHGRSLTDLIAVGQRFPETETCRIAIEILQVLQYLHSLTPPLVHRDIKPENIIRNNDGTISIVDFGAVQTIYQATVAFGSTIVGTYGYMPPEQFQGQATPASDLYGLGTTLLHLLSHKHPSDLPQQRLKLKFRKAVNVSEQFALWLDGLIEPVPEDRFDSASTALNALTSSDQQQLPAARANTNIVTSLSPEKQQPPTIIQKHPTGSRARVERRPDKLSLYLYPWRWSIRTMALATLLIGGLLVVWSVITLALFFEQVSFFVLIMSTIFALGIMPWLSIMALGEILSSATIVIEKHQFAIIYRLPGWEKRKTGSTEDITEAFIRKSSDLSTPVPVTNDMVQSLVHDASQRHKIMARFDRTDSNNAYTVYLAEGLIKRLLGTNLRGAEAMWIVAEINDFLNTIKIKES